MAEARIDFSIGSSSWTTDILFFSFIVLIFFGPSGDVVMLSGAREVHPLVSLLTAANVELVNRK